MGSLAIASGRVYPGVPTSMDDEKQHRTLIATALNNVLRGKLLPTAVVTLADGAATTTLTNPAIGANSLVLLMPTTAHAAAALVSIYFDTFLKGSCKINHVNDADTDKTFTYLVIG